MRQTSSSLWVTSIASLMLFAAASLAEDGSAQERSTLAETAREVGSDLKEAAQEAGKASREIGQELAAGAQRFAGEVSETAQEVWSKGRKVARPLWDDLSRSVRDFWQKIVDDKDRELARLRAENEELKRRLAQRGEAR